jgi:hypothetical protein
VANSYLSHRLGIIESYQKLGRSWLSLILALFLAGVFGIGLILWTIVPCVGWLSGLGMLAFYSLVVVPLIAPIIVLEKQQASHAIRRAWDLARRRFWWVLGFVFILFLFNQMVVTAPVTLATYIFQFVIGDPTNPSASQFTLQTIIQSITTLVFSLIYLPLQMTAITLLYFDLRIRTEGFDMDVLVASVTTDDDSQANPTDLVAHAPPPQRGNWVTGAELGYFVLIEIGAVALYFVVVVVVLGLIFALLGVANSF